MLLEQPPDFMHPIVFTGRGSHFTSVHMTKSSYQETSVVLNKGGAIPRGGHICVHIDIYRIIANDSISIIIFIHFSTRRIRCTIKLLV